MNQTCILVLSCDQYEDCWDIFYRCFKKYWSNCSFPIYLATETKSYDKIPTLCVNEPVWTTRVKKTLEMLETEYVIILLDDFFIRSQVDEEQIHYCIHHFGENTVMFNFELEYSPNIKTDLNGFNLRPPMAPYLHSCQPGVWKRTELINELKIPQTPWQWELMRFSTTKRYYINATRKPIIDIGNYHQNKFSIVRGKWAREVIPFFEKEGIDVDYSQRGFFEE